MKPQLRVGIDVGYKSHRVAISAPDGEILEEFDISHPSAGFDHFFHWVERHRKRAEVPVAVAMEGYNGYARPLDRLIREKSYRLYNVNNLKLARFKQVFPGAAKTDVIDTRKIIELFHLRDQLSLAKDVPQEVPVIPVVNEKLKQLSHRRRRLVNEKIRVQNRFQADLQSVCPELLWTQRAGNDPSNGYKLTHPLASGPEDAKDGSSTCNQAQGASSEAAGCGGALARAEPRDQGKGTRAPAGYSIYIDLAAHALMLMFQ